MCQAMSLRRARISVAGLLASFAISSSFAVEYKVSNASEIDRIREHLKPGDSVVMLNGIWKDQTIIFRGPCTKSSRITLCAEAAGKVVLTGRSSVATDGDYLVVSSLLLKGAEKTTNGVWLGGHHCRLTETAVVDSTYK